MRKQGFGHRSIFFYGGSHGTYRKRTVCAAKWGVEGFSEVRSKEVAPLGIDVTIIEPGGFRTDFAGSSTTICEGLPDYNATVGKIARFQQDYNGKQPGDPVTAANVVIQITNLNEPPLRFLLGSDAANGVEKNDLAKMDADKQWRHLSISTDF